MRNACQLLIDAACSAACAAALLRRGARARRDASARATPAATTRCVSPTRSRQRHELDAHGCASGSRRPGSCRRWRGSSCRRRPARAKNWAAYRARFVEPTRMRAGAAFWQRNQPWLALAEERYGVPPEIVVGIIGVETLLRPADGRLSRHRRAGHAGVRLSSNGRRDRSAFFRDELGRAVRAGVARALRRAGAERLVRRRDRHAAVHAAAHGRATRSTSTATAASTCTAAAPTSIGSVAHYLHAVRLAARHADALRSRGAGRAGRPRGAARARHRAELDRRILCRARRRAGAGGAAVRVCAGAGRAAERRRRAELRGRHAQLLRDHALQLVELLRAWR